MYGQCTLPFPNTGFIAIATGGFNSLGLRNPDMFRLAGDVNDDRKVDFGDFAIIAESWLVDCNANPSNPVCVPDVELNASCPSFDLTDDCFVDFNDFALLAGQWLQAVVPNVIGMTEHNAATALTAASLTVGTVTYQYSETIPANLVFIQNPIRDTIVNIGSDVNMVISRGMPRVPNVIGMTETNAADAITAVSLTVGSVTHHYCDTVAAGLVFVQYPEGGTDANAGSAVNIAISDGPGPQGPNGMVWVSIIDPGVSGHEGFDGQMSKYETTNAQYCQFLNAALASGDIMIHNSRVLGASGSNSGADFIERLYYNLAGPGDDYGGAARINYTGSSFTVDSGFANHPVTYVSWYGATAFCNYYSYRLPTKWEWQAVADYDGSFIYGCGTTIDNYMANYRGSTNPAGTTVVGAFGTYGYGLCDMAGNVCEWTSTDSIVRGDAWNFFYPCTVSWGTIYAIDGATYWIGFRVCR